MSVEARGAAAEPDPANCPAPRADHSGQYRLSGHPARDRAPTQANAGPVHDNRVVIDLVTRARTGDKQAWDAIVERYASLVWSICRSHRLGDADAKDVGQSVWLRLLEQLDSLRDPAALPAWLATTARRECIRILSAARGPVAARYGLNAEILADDQAGTVEQDVLVAERHAALYEAFLALPPRDQQLITLLIQDPPVPYAEISARLGIAVGSVGPNRSRCVDRLRRHPAIAALISAEA